MKSITFTCETITPMFLAGADGKTPELRAASIKGAMRFWWRAMNSEYIMKHKTDSPNFGNTDIKSKFSIFCDEISSLNSYIGNNLFRDFKGLTPAIRYLAYGVEERQYIRPGFIFRVTFLSNNLKLMSVIQSFVALSEFGGLGAKTRNGFGKFKITKSEVDKKELKLPQLSPAYKELPMSRFTSLSKETKLFYTKKTGSWIDILTTLGNVYKDAKKSLDEKGEYINRSLIASPIIHHDSVTDVATNMSFLERHGKQVFLVLKPEGETLRGLILTMPYKFMSGVESLSEENKEKVFNYELFDDENIEKAVNQYIDVFEQFTDHIASNNKMK